MGCVLETQSSLKTYTFNHTPTQLNKDQILQLTRLLSNPAESLQAQMSGPIHIFFNSAFMQSFAGVMWFLFSASILILLSVLASKIQH